MWVSGGNLCTQLPIRGFCMRTLKTPAVPISLETLSLSRDEREAIVK